MSSLRSWFQRKWLGTVVVSTLLSASLTAAAFLAIEAPQSFVPGGFIAELDLDVPGSPDEVYDWFTRDVSEWWDHTFWGDPKQLKFEARPGGMFVEMLGEEEGARHAEVITAQRGKLLRFVGPLGLAGKGIDVTHELTFADSGGETHLHLTLIGNGRVEKGWPETIQSVWSHFLVERFLPYAKTRSGS